MVEGGGGGETFNVSADGGHAMLQRNIGAFTIDTSAVEALRIAAAGGADTLVVGDLAGTGVTDVYLDLANDGAADAVTLVAGPGVTSVSMVQVGGLLVITGLAATVTISGFESGLDTLLFTTPVWPRRWVGDSLFL